MNDTTTRWVVRRLDPETDIDAVLEISADAFRRPLTRSELDADLARSDHTWIYVIRPAGAAPQRRPPVGYCVALCIRDELHINTLAIRTGWRGRGAARCLLAATLEAAARAGAVRATLEVRRSNHAARRLYERSGFIVRGTRRQYYSDPPDDALILWREPGGGA